MQAAGRRNGGSLRRRLCPCDDARSTGAVVPSARCLCRTTHRGLTETSSSRSSIVSKHPDLAGRVEDVKAALSRPDEVRRSRRDHDVLLFYRREEARLRWVAAVAKKSDGDGFLITAYRTDAVKEGERDWPK